MTRRQAIVGAVATLCLVAVAATLLWGVSAKLGAWGSLGGGSSSRGVASIPSPTTTPKPKTWALTKNVKQGKIETYITGLQALSNKDIWAVGEYADSQVAGGAEPRMQPLIEHFDGSSWTVKDSPSPTQWCQLAAITMISTSDGWAVGGCFTQDYPGAQDKKALIEQWDGSSWRAVEAPAGPYVLLGISAVSQNNIWAVGNGQTSGTSTFTLALHWDGKMWTRQQTPNPGMNAALSSVAAVATDDVWAVGTVGFTNVQGLILHWDGASWRVNKEGFSSGNSILDTIVARGKNDIWTIGQYDMVPAQQYSPGLIAHWDGSSWTPSSGSGAKVSQALRDISVVSDSDIWVAGEDNQATSSATLEHFDGQRWTNLSDYTTAGAQLKRLFCVVALPDGEVWAAGNSASGESYFLSYSSYR